MPLLPAHLSHSEKDTLIAALTARLALADRRIAAKDARIAALEARLNESARPPKTAVEMPRLWKSQNDFHSRLEISHRTRDSHIPTAASLMAIRPKTKTRTRYAAPCHAPQEVLDSRPAVGHANRRVQAREQLRGERF